jgi:hypothetical protein
MTKAELHKLVDELPDEVVEAAGRFLERAARDPMLSVLDAAPWDDEPVTPAEDAAVKAAEAERSIPYRTVRKELLG